MKNVQAYLAAQNVTVLDNPDGFQETLELHAPGCYLYHFDRKWFHSQHYLGGSQDIAYRMGKHKKNNGIGDAKLIAAVKAQRIDLKVVRVWLVRDVAQVWPLERFLKHRKKARDYCPVCRADRKVG